MLPIRSKWLSIPLGLGVAATAAVAILPSAKTYQSNDHRAVSNAPCFQQGTSDAVVAYYTQLLGQVPDGHSDYNINNSWSSPQGTPFNLTWSFVPDGLAIGGGAGEGTAGSNLFAMMDSKAPRATWTAKFQQVFDRWAALSGLRYTRLKSGSNDWDDGASWGSAGNGTTRGDCRIGMHNIDGSSNILAYDTFPTQSDMVLDSGDINLFGGSGSDYVFLRNVVAHEHGHGFGLLHVCPSNQTKLMEPFISTAYDGPRHDDMRAAMRNYGDVNENPGKNNTSATATNIGTLVSGTPVTLGAVPAPSVGTASSLLSIDGTNDVDFYKFTSTASTASITINVVPKGLIYDSSPQNSDGSCASGNNVNSNTAADLQVALIDKNGTTVLASANNTTAGNPENLVGSISSSGTYFIKVSAVGAVNSTQMYTLQVTLSSCTPPTITQQPQSQTVIVGDSASLNMNVSGSFFNYSYQWRRNGVNLVEGGSISGSQSRNLSIDPVAFSDAGDYDCKVTEISTSCSSVTSIATLNVTDCIPFTTQPTSTQQVCGGDTLILQVAVSSPSPTYQWRVGTTNLVDGGRISGSTTTTLTISGFQSGDANSNYNCVVSDATLGCSSTSNSASVTYGSPVVINQQPTNQTLNVGDALSLSMNVSGSFFNYIYKWRLNGVDLTDDSRINGSDTRFLGIDPIQAGDAGAYDCRVTSIQNGCVKYTNAATVTVNSTCLGDLDHSGTIDLSDLSILLSHYGLTGQTADQGDLTGDGNVDLSDLSLLLSVYGHTCP